MATTSSLKSRGLESTISGDGSQFSFFDPPNPAETLEDELPHDCNLGGLENMSSFRSLFAFTTTRASMSSILVVAVFASIGAGILKPVSAIFFGNIFSALTNFGAGQWNEHDTLQNVSTWCLALVGLGVAAWVFEGLLVSTWMVFGECQARQARESLFQGLLDKGMEWYDLQKDGIGSLLSRIQTQVRELQLAVSQPLGFLIFEAVGSISALGTAFYYSWRLTFVVMAAFPVAAVVLSFVSMKIGPAIEAQKQWLTQASKTANTAVLVIDTVKAFNGQSEELWKYRVGVKSAAEYYLVQVRANAMQFAITKFTLVGIFVQGFWYGIYLNSKGAEPGHIVTAFYACLNAIQAVETLLPQWLVLKKGMSAGETLKSVRNELQGSQKPLQDGPIVRPFSCDGDIDFNKVHFTYPSNPRRIVLDHTSFFFPSGETIFVVGKSGSGKSTLGNLLAKLYELQEGAILVDRQSIHRLDTHWLRQNITLVQQRSVLLNDTLLNNILFGSTKQYKHETWRIEQACAVAGLGEVIHDLDEGLDTVMGSTGRSLSGGQMQRVAIARAHLRNTPILILDEATSALDPTSRNQILVNIRHFRRHMTTIIITHDVSQIQEDDFVYVMEDGSIIQEGYCQDLDDMYHGTFAKFRRASCTPEGQYPERNRHSEPTSLYAVESCADGLLSQSGKGWTNFSVVFAKDSPRSSTSSRIMSTQATRMPLGFKTIQENALQASSMLGPSFVKRVEEVDDQVATELRRFCFTRMPFMSPRAAPKPPLRVIYSKDIEIETLMPDDPRLRDYNIHRPIPSPVNTNVHGANSKQSIFPPLSARFRNLRRRKETSEAKTATLQQIFSTVWPTLVFKDRCTLLFGLFAAFIVACATPAFALIFAKLLNVFYETENQAAEARKWSLALLGTAIVDGIATFCTHYALECCGQAWVDALRIEALRRILNQPRSWFDQEKNCASRLNECLDRNAEEMRNLIGRFAGPVFTIFFMLGISIGWAFTISWKLTLIALACSPVMYGIMRTFHLVSSSWEEKCNQASSVGHIIFTEVFSDISFVRSLNLESRFRIKHAIAITRAYTIGRTRALYSGLLFGLNDSSTFYTAALIFYSGTRMITLGSNSVNSIISVMNLLLFSIANATSLLSVIPQISSAKVTATHMLELVNLLERSTHETGGKRRISSPFPIQFNNLNFNYPSQPKIKALQGINLTLKPGTITALVGPSGSGKSTLASLLLGLHTPTPAPPFSPPPFHSPLTFDSLPSTSIHLPSLRTLITYVPQQPTLFPTSIFQNIVYGLPPAAPYNTYCAATRAAKQAGIHEFILGLDRGYSTHVGDGGLGLSGGQTQRIAIARALVRRPKLLILDEATSALDASAAEGVRGVLRGLVEGSLNDVAVGDADEAMSVLIISHSVEMMKVADGVVVMEGGKIVEKGGFEELSRRRGALWRLLGGGA